MSSRLRGWLIALVGVGVVGLAIVGVLIGTGAFSSEEPAAAPQTSETASPRGTAPSPKPPPPAQPVDDEGQPPGTVKLAHGGTAKLVQEEIDSSGTLPVPENLDEATWWGAGLDASKGATVLAGHVNWKGSVGPFSELWDSQRGDEVTVQDESSKTWRYEVSEIVTLDKEELPQRAPELFGQGGEHRLVLVTCGGRFVGGDTGYDENRIVVAQPAA